MSVSTGIEDQQIIKSSKIKVIKISTDKNQSKKDFSPIEIKYYPWTKVGEIRTRIASIKVVPPKILDYFLTTKSL